jgi:hypothetical protein
MNGIFCCWAVRIFFCIRSSESSTSARIPASRSRSAKDARYAVWSDRIGIPTTCTGASHAGNAPA